MDEFETVNKDQLIVQLEIKKYNDKQRGEFNKAFAKFQQAVKAPAKNGEADFPTKKGGKVSYKYVQLDDLIKAINTGLNGTGISWHQNVNNDINSQGAVIEVSTIISFENGYEKKVSPIKMVCNTIKPQDIASVITYAKRYSLSASFGVNSDEDNDANNTNTNVNPNYGRSSYSKSKRKSTPNQKQTPNKSKTSSKRTELNEKRNGWLKQYSQLTGNSGKEIYESTKKDCGISNVDTVNDQDYEQFVTFLVNNLQDGMSEFAKQKDAAKA